MSKKTKSSDSNELANKQAAAAIDAGMQAVKEGAPLFPTSNVLHKIREQAEQEQKNEK